MKTKDRKLLLITIAFVLFLIADVALFVSTSFLGVAFSAMSEWHQIVVNILLIMLVLIVVRGPGWQGKVKQSRAYSFGAKSQGGTKRRGAA